MKILAQTNLGTIGGSGLGPFGEIGAVNSPITTIIHGVSAIIGFLTLAAFIWFIFQLVIGGIQWITSAGDKNGLESARNRLTHAFIGLIIVVAGVSILTIIGQFLGINIVNPNISF